MYLGIGTVSVSASIDVHGDTDMNGLECPNGGVELILGCDPTVTLYCTAQGRAKLIEALRSPRPFE